MSSNAQVSFPHVTEADNGYSEIEILSSTISSTQLSSPWAMAPIKKTRGVSLGNVVTYEDILTAAQSDDIVILRQLGGK